MRTSCNYDIYSRFVNIVTLQYIKKKMHEKVEIMIYSHCDCHFFRRIVTLWRLQLREIKYTVRLSVLSTSFQSIEDFFVFSVYNYDFFPNTSNAIMSSHVPDAPV